MFDDTITIVVPVFNEANNVGKLVKNINEALKGFENWDILFVNDGSEDNTLEVLEKLSESHPNLKIVDIPHAGFAEAMKTGYKKASGTVIVTMDGDNTHNAADIVKLVDSLKNADLAIGSRYVGTGGMDDVSLWRHVISIFANNVFKLVTRVHVRDVTGGFRAIRKDLLNTVNLESNGFEIQLEMTIKAVKRGFRVIEVPTRLSVREKGESKFSLRKEFLGYLRILYKSFWW